MKNFTNYGLKRYNTFGIDARCSRFVEFSSVDEARQVAALLSGSATPYIIIGGGSNLLLTGDYAGTVVRSAIRGISVTGQEADQVMVRCGSGERWDDVVAWSVANGLYGAENLSLIPGDVGASAVQNIGAYGAEVCQLVRFVEVVEIATGQVGVLPSTACGYGYRDSRFKREWSGRYLITHVSYLLSRQYRPLLDYGNIRSELQRRGISQPTAAQLRDTIIGIRREKLPDPSVTGNAGSFFMNPVVERAVCERLLAQYPAMPHYAVDDGHEKIPAGWLIEQCGWKGRSLGPAGVHDRQALVLVNRGGATGQDIVALCQAVQCDVRQRFGISLQPEVNIV